MGEGKAAAMKPRPIVRLAIFLISHSFLVSVVCFTAGVVALLLLPVLAKNTYISENALMPGSANSMLSSHDVAKAYKLMKDITNSNSKSPSAGMEIPRLIAKHIMDLGAEVSYHSFYPQLHRFHPLHFFTGPDTRLLQENISSSACGVNIVGIVRAPRGDGKEAIVLVTPYNSLKPNQVDTVSLGIAYSVLSLLARVTWLAKDIIWLAADSQFGEYTSVSAWLRDYHTPEFSRIGNSNSEFCNEGSTIFEMKENEAEERKLLCVFRRAGTMAAALVIKVVDRNAESEDTLKIYAEASNGQMPNLDLINVVKYLAVHRQGLHVKVEKLWSLLDSRWIKFVGVVFELVGKVARNLNPQWKFGIPVVDYIEGSATLASSLYLQALGVPTGPHGAFRDYQVDAITMEVSPRLPLNNKARKNEFLQRGGRLIEGVIRSVNNLLEKFHQSFFLYLLTSPGQFVSVGVYMIGFALLVASLPLVAASLYADSSEKGVSLKNEKTDNSVASADVGRHINIKSWKWLQAVKKVFIIHLWGAIVSLVPYFICQIPNRSSTTSILLWILLSMFSLLFLYFISGSSFSQYTAVQPHNREWDILKAAVIAAAFIGLCLMSVINFAAAEIGAFVIIPMCLTTHPLKLDIKNRNLKTLSRAACNIMLGFIGFPPAAFLFLKCTFGDFGSANVGDFWTWLESLWAWNSATYLYIFMVHLPCWALCIHILFHPC